MVRARFTVEVRYGKFAEYLKASEKMNEIARDRGWAEATFWVAAVGKANELIAEVDYPDMATFESEGAASAADAEWMQVIRSTVDLVVQGTARSELFQEAPQLA
jgi:hypothetical protein